MRATHELPGSEPRASDITKDTESISDRRLDLTLHLRPEREIAESSTELGPGVGKPRPRETVRDRSAASQADLDAVTAYADSTGLQVLSGDRHARMLHLQGSANQVERAFGVHLASYRHPEHEESFVSHQGCVKLPPDLIEIVESIEGLDETPRMRPHVRTKPESGGASAKGTFPQDVAAAYGFPAGDGAGQSLALIELGGGFEQSWIDQYFEWLPFDPPTVVSVEVGAATNTPMNPNSLEVLLDLCVAGAICPKATLVVYFAKDIASGIKAAVSDAVHHHSAISLSWGSDELQYAVHDAPVRTLSAIGRGTESALSQAREAQIPVFVSAGDNGSGDSRQGSSTVLTDRATVEYPASSPQVIACGGTSLQLDSAHRIVSEVVWNDLQSNQGTPSFVAGKVLPGGATGGGVSQLFDLPDWQSSAGLDPTNVNPLLPDRRQGRGVPDVAGNADYETPYLIFIPRRDGPQPAGGTSAVAPLWAALTLRVNEHLPAGQRVLDWRPLLYGAKGGLCRPITAGNNDTSPGVGGYVADPHWSACTGWGSPDGAKLLEALKNGQGST